MRRNCDSINIHLKMEKISVLWHDENLFIPPSATGNMMFSHSRTRPFSAGRLILEASVLHMILWFQKWTSVNRKITFTSVAASCSSPSLPFLNKTSPHSFWFSLWGFSLGCRAAWGRLACAGLPVFRAGPHHPARIITAGRKASEPAGWAATSLVFREERWRRTNV